jgi:iron(III) transport system substrate-binding protein
MCVLGAKDSLLAAFRPTWADAIDPLSRGEGDLYFGVYRTPVVLVYNSVLVTEAEAPSDWEDMLAERFDQRVLIRDPLESGTMRAIFGMVLQRSLTASGDTALGMAWLRRLDARTREYTLNPALLHEKLTRGEGWVTVWDLPDIQLQQRQGRPLEYRFPTSGTPVIDDAIGVVRGAQRDDEARAFVEWIGSMKMQLVAAREAYRLPARLDIPSDSLPEWARAVLREMVSEDMDWKLVAREGAGWMRYWDRRVRGTGNR